MGRHSAPDDDADESSDGPVAGPGPVALREREDARSRGRHYRSDGTEELAEAETGRIPPVLDASVTDAPVTDAPVTDAAVPDLAVSDPPVTEVTLDELIGAPDSLADDVTERIPPVVPDRPRPTGAPATEQPGSTERPGSTEHPGSPGRRGASPQVAVKHAAHNSAADLHLVRSHRIILALCALAVLIPFAVDVAVLTVIGDVTLRRFLVWIWAPLIAAGVLVGLVLDAGHRRYATTRR